MLFLLLAASFFASAEEGVAGGVLTREVVGTGPLFSANYSGDAEFPFERKTSEKKSLGVDYRLAEFGHEWLGLEYQVLNEAGHPKARNGPSCQLAGLYDLNPASDSKELKAEGERKQSRNLKVREF